LPKLSSISTTRSKPGFDVSSASFHATQAPLSTLPKKLFSVGTMPLGLEFSL
jgi:hypothetical protein